MGTPIEHLHVLKLRWHDLAALSDREKATFSLMCLIVSELNVLRRLALLSMHDLEHPVALGPAIAIQRNLLLRTMSAKLFEFIKFFDKWLAKEVDGSQLKLAYDTFLTEVMPHKIGVGFDVAYFIRNKIANHYDLNKASESALGCNGNIECDLYMTEANGNSYYPMGDELIFAHSLAENFNARGEPEKFNAALDAWMDWVLSMSELVNRFHLYIFVNIVDPVIPQSKMRHRPEFVPIDLVAKHPGFRLPIFIRIEP